MKRKMLVTIYLFLLVFFCGFANNFNIIGEYILSISPNSEKIIVLNRYQNEDVICVKDIEQKVSLFEKGLDRKKIQKARWVNNESIVVVLSDTTYHLFNINTKEERLIDCLKGIFPKGLSVNYKSQKLFIGAKTKSNSKNGKFCSRLYIYDFNQNTKDYYSINGDFGWLLDIKDYKDDLYLLNLGGFLSIMDLHNNVITKIGGPEKGNIDIGESRINISKNKEILLFSIEDKKIAIYNMKKMEITIVTDLLGYAFPILAPNNSFFFITKIGNYPYEQIKIKNNLF